MISFRSPFGITLAGATALLTLAAACEKRGVPREITERRSLSDEDRSVPLETTSSERFGFKSAAAEAAPENPFRWEKPESWTAAEATSMRVANFRFGEDGAGECYLSAMPGAAGGAVANINRWRSQMGLEPASEEEIEALPKKALLGQPAPFASLEGSFKGMGVAEARANYRMLGVILSFPQFTLFVKMVGPGELVRAEEENFDTFCRSLTIVSSGADQPSS
ncbi:MAG: hypothetical protein ACC661_03565 [Verrucomicrobiales bacterium]